MYHESKHGLNNDITGGVKTHVPPPLPPRKSYRFLIIAIVISLSLHLALILLVPRLFPADPVDKRAAALEVWFAQPKPIPTVKPKDMQKKTVVTLDLKNNQQRPKHANYLAEQDHTVPEEKTARLKSSYPMATDDALNVQEPETMPEKGHKIGKKHLTEQHFLKTKKHPDPLGLKQGLGPKSPSFSDHIPGKKNGDHTELNAWQWRHAPFFNRLKARIGQIWAPQRQISRYDPEGLLLGHKDRVTVMSVTIDSLGGLKDLSVSESSGVAYLDEEAERAFKEAAPFSFPPKELFNEVDEFSFTFAFYLQINRGFSFDFDWKRD